MNLNLVTILIIAAAAVIGIGLGYSNRHDYCARALKTKPATIIKDAEKQANILKEKRMLEAKERFLQLKTEHDNYTVEKNKQLTTTENRLRQKEQSLKPEIRTSHSAKKKNWIPQKTTILNN